MEIKLDINKAYESTTVTIHTPQWSKEIENVIEQLESTTSVKRIAGINGDQTMILDPTDIDYLYAQARKVYASVAGQSFEVNLKLYDAESLLKPFQFVRFSKSVVGNVNRIDRFELSFNGNLCVYFRSGEKEYVSKKYVKAIKENLFMEGDQV